MAAEPSIPDSVELCRRELAAKGYRLEAVPDAQAAYCFDLIKNDADGQHPVDRFGHLLWTELESAQAALRFARYFETAGTPINGLTTTSPAQSDKPQ